MLRHYVDQVVFCLTAPACRYTFFVSPETLKTYRAKDNEQLDKVIRGGCVSLQCDPQGKQYK